MGHKLFCSQFAVTPPPPPQSIDIVDKIAHIVATMSLQQKAQALKLIEILALELD
jgi:hypothetical protein